jgi:hypothetical protein
MDTPVADNKASKVGQRRGQATLPDLFYFLGPKILWIYLLACSTFWGQRFSGFTY